MVEVWGGRDVWSEVPAADVATCGEVDEIASLWVLMSGRCLFVVTIAITGGVLVKDLVTDLTRCSAGECGPDSSVLI